MEKSWSEGKLRAVLACYWAQLRLRAWYLCQRNAFQMFIIAVTPLPAAHDNTARIKAEGQ